MRIYEINQADTSDPSYRSTRPATLHVINSAESSGSSKNKSGHSDQATTQKTHYPQMLNGIHLTLAVNSQ
jgi:hypothetical protein